MSVLDGPGEGTWSVFAQKVVEQRDRAIEERNDVFRRLRDVERSMFSMEAERDAARKERDAAQQMVAELRAVLTAGRDIVIETSGRHTRWVEGAYDTLEASAPIAGRWCLASERDEALRLLATRVEAKRLDAAREEIERLRAACTLALRIMEQKNKVNVPPLAKFIEVTFDPEDMAVLRAALEKKP